MYGVTYVEARSRPAIDAALSAVHAGARVLLHFSGATDSSGASWCSDCVESAPILASALAAAGASAQLTVIYIPLERAEFKGVASHWARAPPFGVSRIPTLARWGKSRVVAALVEGECKDAAGVADFLAEA